MHSSRMPTVRSSSRLLGGCTWSHGGVPGPGGCTWSWGMCIWSRGVYLVLGGVPGPGGAPCPWGVYLVPGSVPGLGDVPGPRGVYLIPGGCTWSQEVYLVLGGIPGPRGFTWPQGAPAQVLPQGLYLVLGVYLVWGAWGCTWFQGDVPGPKGVYLVPGGVPDPRGVYVPFVVCISEITPNRKNKSYDSDASG